MSDYEIRQFVYEDDLDEVKRIWKEVGWVDDEHGAQQLDHFFSTGETLLATVDGKPECSVHTVPADMQIHESVISMLAVTAVTTSHLGRGRAFAQRLTAQQLIRAQEEGCGLSVLGMFDQGFYDKLGFGTGGYEREFVIDPGTLTVPVPRRTAARLTVEDYEEMHECLVQRYRQHGSVSLHPAKVYRGDIGFGENAFGLGYRDDSGVLTHFVWLDPGETPAHGPYDLKFVAYREPEQLLELFGLLRSLADQIYSVSLIEPPDVQLQILLERPLRNADISRGSKHASNIRSLAWWQARILDLPICIAALAGASDEFSFEADIADPLADYGDGAGVTGSWRIQLGSAASAERCEPGATGLPVMRASINAMTRLVLGVGAPSNLALTDDLEGSHELLRDLDTALHVRSPVLGWDF
ncbi:MAG: GNAT family N-acetyltransferase [Pseudomonadales bacterium]|nr:GNAT family N-acetyltransferase [Pseudomonadales bacterium]